MKIRFKTIHNEVLEHLPFPIKKEIPDWYKELSGHWDNKRVPNTVKKCMPFRIWLLYSPTRRPDDEKD